ncbi:hypothetical protein [Xanthomonas sacchari]|uniref:hypothetical protein n=1 Tax=Xanthomonas sacchari TaxID=56458 RepID=UPI00110FFB2B|nr:hypothetical protein [Xanthomonas sacchari]MDV0440476.1 hypothetical protein [Xanthomonas sacchari]
MIRLILTAILALACTSVHADEPLPAALSPADEAAKIASAQTVGSAIYLHDQAASVATDAVLAVPEFRRDKRVRGWVTEQQGADIVVTFLDSTPAAIYRVAVTNGKAGSVKALEAPVALTAYEAGAAQARAAATTAQFERCAKKYNSVVLPGKSPEEDWVVYLLPATTKNNVVPIGGTYRFSVKDARVVSQRAFTRTCIVLETGPKVEALMITHLLDPVPTEAHVFWSLWARKPIYVATAPAGTIWTVQGDQIRLVERK